jgi:hypothetical protein
MKTIIITLEGGNIDTKCDKFDNPIEILGALRFAEFQLLQTWTDLMTSTAEIKEA